MWYFAEIVFAEPEAPGRRMYACGTSEVLLRAESAAEAYAKAQAWAEARLREGGTTQRILGVSHLSETLDEDVGDGMELCGRLMQRRDVWERRDEFIPLKERLPAFIVERRADDPVGEVLAEIRGPKAIRSLKRYF